MGAVTAPIIARNMTTTVGCPHSGSLIGTGSLKGAEQWWNRHAFNEVGEEGSSGGDGESEGMAGAAQCIVEGVHEVDHALRATSSRAETHEGVSVTPRPCSCHVTGHVRIGIGVI